ncbi:MAG: ribonuclease III [Bacteroidales bacterium]|jgi:ribonuclease-3|nr:ribonuclease III [Bacteroidales bacterium]
MFKFFIVQFSKDKILYTAVKNLLGFYPHNIYLYKVALSHKSAPQVWLKGQQVNNERLEYLGDAVLSSIVADYLYKKFPYQNEGFLTEMRSRIVSRSRFNKLSLKMGLNDLIFQGNGLAFTSSKSIYGDTFEALIGAVYLDKGYNFTRKVVIRRIIDVHLDVDEIERTDTNYKSRILEYAQREKRQLEFKVIQEIGEGHRKQYLVELFIDNLPVSRGQDFSIKAAEQVAAEKACEELIGE